MPDETAARSEKKASNTPPPGRFVVRSLVLLGLTVLFYWIGWRSPWARADQRVQVEIADPPKAVTATAAPAEAWTDGNIIKPVQPVAVDSARQAPSGDGETRLAEPSSEDGGREQPGERVSRRRNRDDDKPERSRTRRHRKRATEGEAVPLD